MHSSEDEAGQLDFDLEPGDLHIVAAPHLGSSVLQHSLAGLRLHQFRYRVPAGDACDRGAEGRNSAQRCLHGGIHCRVFLVAAQSDISRIRLARPGGARVLGAEANSLVVRSSKSVDMSGELVLEMHSGRIASGTHIQQAVVCRAGSAHRHSRHCCWHSDLSSGAEIACIFHDPCAITRLAPQGEVRRTAAAAGERANSIYHRQREMHIGERVMHSSKGSAIGSLHSTR